MSDEIRAAYAGVFKTLLGQTVLEDLFARTEYFRFQCKPGMGMANRPDFYFGTAELLDYIHSMLREKQPHELARSERAGDFRWTDSSPEPQVPAEPVVPKQTRRRKSAA